MKLASLSLPFEQCAIIRAETEVSIPGVGRVPVFVLENAITFVVITEADIPDYYCVLQDKSHFRVALFHHERLLLQGVYFTGTESDAVKTAMHSYSYEPFQVTRIEVEPT